MKQTSIPKTRFMTNPPFYIKPIFSNLYIFNTIFFYHFQLTNKFIAYIVLSVLHIVVHLILIRKETLLLHIQLDPRSNTPIWEQIVQNIKELVLKNMLAPSDKLPSVRELASLLVINPNTVSKAYQELERQGIIETLRGNGTFVSQSITPTLDERKIAMVEKQFHQLLLEASYLGITKDKLRDWIDSYYKEIGGSTDAESDKLEENN